MIGVRHRVILEQQIGLYFGLRRVPNLALGTCANYSAMHAGQAGQSCAPGACRQSALSAWRNARSAQAPAQHPVSAAAEPGHSAAHARDVPGLGHAAVARSGACACQTYAGRVASSGLPLVYSLGYACALWCFALFLAHV